MNYVRNIFNWRKRAQRNPQEMHTNDILQEILKSPGLRCRLCGEAAEVQLVGSLWLSATERSKDSAAEFLCYEHVGSFVGTWADPRILEWAVVRL